MTAKPSRCGIIRSSRMRSGWNSPHIGPTVRGSVVHLEMGVAGGQQNIAKQRNVGRLVIDDQDFHRAEGKLIAHGKKIGGWKGVHRHLPGSTSKNHAYTVICQAVSSAMKIKAKNNAQYRDDDQPQATMTEQEAGIIKRANVRVFAHADKVDDLLLTATAGMAANSPAQKIGAWDHAA